MQVMLELKGKTLRKTIKIVLKKWKNICHNTPNSEIFSKRSPYIWCHLSFLFNYQLHELFNLSSVLQIFFSMNLIRWKLRWF